MSTLKDTYIPSAEYNSLPTMDDVANVPVDHREDCEALCALLRKYNLPEHVGVRLVHKHFDAVDDEVMVLRVIEVPSIGSVRVMGPLNPHQNPSLRLRGLNYVVDEDGNFQPYEYTTSGTAAPDMSKYSAFLEEFAGTIIERKLQRKWGLKIGFDGERTGWTEFEIPANRSTILIPKATAAVLRAVQSAKFVTTDWHAAEGMETGCPTTRSGTHYGQTHCPTTRSGTHYGTSAAEGETEGSDANELFFAGEKLEYGTPLYSLVHTAILAM